MSKLSLKDLSLKGKKVLMRVDFNVPLNKDGTIADNTRILEDLPSIKYIQEQGGSVILMSHLGRPKGKPDPKYSLKVCAEELKKLIKTPVLFAPDCIGKEVDEMKANLKSGEVLLLENVRFHSAEEDPSSDPSFAKNLAKLADFFVNDAFGTAHREHSSTATVAKYFPNKAAMGFLIEKEISFLNPLVTNPKRPFFAIIGGAKISSKMGVLKALLNKVDALFIGGGMAYTFYKAQGMKIGNSIHEDDLLAEAKELLKISESKKIPIYLPQDSVIADSFTESAKSKIVSAKDGIPDGWQGMDIGPKTLAEWEPLLKKAATVFWNGPLGVFEFAPFAKGTQEIAKTLSNLKAITIVGGGDSVSAINQLKIADKFTHVSTGGGASLEYIEFGKLPGIEALSDKT